MAVREKEDRKLPLYAGALRPSPLFFIFLKNSCTRSYFPDCSITFQEVPPVRLEYKYILINNILQLESLSRH